MSDLIPPELKSASPTKKLAYLALRRHGECRAEVLWEDLGTSPGSVYPALEKLEDRGLATRRPALHPKSGYYWRLTDQEPAITGEIGDATEANP